MLTVQHQSSPRRWLTVAQRLTVERDVSGVELIAKPGARIEGRIVRDGFGPFDLSTLSVGLGSRVELSQGLVGERVSRALPRQGRTVEPDGRFALDDVSGPVKLLVWELPPGWSVKGIRLDGADITDQYTDFGDGVRRGVEIVLTDQSTHVWGRVSDRQANTVSNYTVVVCPEDRSKWESPSRFVRAVRSGSDGAYGLDGLPPADYVAVAVSSLTQNAWSDRRLLETLWPIATPFQLADGEQRVLDLRLSSIPAGVLLGN